MKLHSTHNAPELAYGLNEDTYDEMLDSRGQVRPHWVALMHALEELGSTELESRQQEAHKLLRENGVTYNIYGDPDGINRPWQLDPLPLLISGEEWRDIETGLLQRAELLNLILADLYGPRELIKKNLLPLELIYNHDGFLRACDQVKLPTSRQLVFYAADLARGPDQKMWVIGDRTQAPSGAGYALENRMAVSRVLPQLFRDSQAFRLERFFQSIQAGLNTIAAPRIEAPRVVVLTPGPFNETFFEHSYLASFLGYSLVQGNDLTVRDGHVWLKSLTGLQRVDVILRRVDDNYCDPLELLEDSCLGVPGLLEVARRGNVSIANPLGSGVLENPGIQPFLPAISRHFLGQNLKLPTAATWWCGQPKEMDFVLANLDELVIKSIYRGPGERSVFGSQLSKSELAQWRERIRANPKLYIGQEHVSFSTAPSVTSQGLDPRKILLRCFAVARHNGYEIMPGGLTRSAPEKGDMPITGQSGSISKDTWIIASEPQYATANVGQTQAISSRNHHSDALPSRAADNIFWVGRYAERAEGSVRLLRATVKKLYINPEPDNANYQACIHNLLRSITSLTGTWPGFFMEEADTLLSQPETELLSVTLDEDRVGSLAHSLRRLVKAGYAARDLWSSDTWRVMDELENGLIQSQHADETALWQMQGNMDMLITTLSALSGLVMESMTRNDGWLFLDIGRRLERGLQLISIMRTAFSVKHEANVETQLIESLLNASDNLICYRQQYRSYFELSSFLELLLLDENNPRSLIYQIMRLQEHVAKIPSENSERGLSTAQRLTLEAGTMIKLVNLNKLLEVSEDGMREHLDQQLSRLYYLLSSLSDAISTEHFRHGSVPQPL
ncbi:MAG TPA: circularly permuted type 2 ATP-grasp protein [Methylophilaceae bacterium]